MLGTASPPPWLHLPGARGERSSACHGSAAVAQESRVASRLRRPATRLRSAALPLVLAAGALAVSRPAHARSWTFVGLAGRDETGLSALLARQQDPSSAEYRRWLTPREFGERFGASRVDVRRASRWLRDAGCRVRRFPSRRLLACAGPPQLAVPESLRRLVSDTFCTSEAPDVVFNLVGPLPQSNAVLQGQPFFTPQEFARVYGLGPAVAPAVDGGGQTIGLLALSALDPADVVAFREAFGLPPLDLDQDGGIRQSGTTAEAEAVLDVTWSGAIAPGARVVLAVGSVVADSLAALVNRADVDVISSSITLCPTRTSRPFIRAAALLFRQAAAQGQTVFFASGDQGPIACDRRGVDPLTASPLVTAVGGTSPTPLQDDAGAFIGYGTETVWTEPGAASGGGPSRKPRPRWQRGRPTRTVPDVAFPAALLYPIVLDGSLTLVGGTSAAAPAWAGALAQLNQVRGQRAGFLNPELYRLGNAQRRGGAAVFHDVTVGSNSVDGVRGFLARAGYDLATGWGSLDGPTFFAAFTR
jgi:subtilase family serine protease